MKRSFAVLREAALEGNVMACFDAGFMMIQGIGCKKNWKGGMKLLEKGCSLVRDLKDDCWRADGSVSELFEPQSMDLKSLFCVGGFDEHDEHDEHDDVNYMNMNSQIDE